ncbi:PQQ-binding-like beta-propeller repeat protein [uncultured Acetobacteroides sp.]|uniref:outer membrane protein assembly factor BamB family protein n=1 Tax=uncultured Acetobacteroides sp. TaxID=1760811 RepID=UPI0029F5717F|nr:PQQ-binding-like beta-propeller repeat protein [uncultured Acetobacteroides sp.]
MNKYKVALAIPFTLASLALSAQTYTGKVFSVQTSKKGVSKEVPLSEVVVTDGVSVTSTRSDGTFELESLPKSRPSYIAITTPDEYSTAIFYQPVSGKAQPYQFQLNKIVEKKGHSAKFIMINDISQAQNERWLSSLKQQTFYFGVSFVVSTGKSVGELDLEKELGLPVYHAAYGNSKDDGFPNNYSFIRGGVHFVVLSGPSDSMQHPIHWLKNMLVGVGRSYPTILITSSAIVKHNEESLSANGDTLSLNDFNVKAIVDGGKNINLYDYTGKLTTSTICTAPLTSGGEDHSPAGFRLVSVTDKGIITTETILSNVPNSATIVSPGDTAYVEDNKIRFYANVSSSQSPIKRVRIGISRDTMAYKWSELNNVSPWTWSGFYVLTPADTASRYSVKLESFTESGQMMVAEKNISLVLRKDSTVLSKGLWGNLGGNAGHDANILIPFTGKLCHQWTASPQGATLFSSPMVVDSVVVTPLANDLAFNKSELTALHVKTGKSLWHFFPKGAVKNTFIIDGKNVVATDILGNVYAIDVNTGLPTWETSLGNYKDYDYVGSSFADSLYFTGNTDRIAALRLSDGSVVWTLGADVIYNGCESTLTVGDGVLLAQNRKGGLLGIDIRTGKIAWSTSSIGFSSSSISSSFSNGVFHVVSGNKYYAIDSKNGVVTNTATLPSAISTKSIPLISDNLLIYGSVNNGLVAYDLQNSRQQWSVEVGAALVNTLPGVHEHQKTVETSPVRIGSYVVFGASDGYLYVANISNGAVEQKINLGAPVLSSIAVVGDMLFVTDLSGNLSAFKLSLGKQIH